MKHAGLVLVIAAVLVGCSQPSSAAAPAGQADLYVSPKGNDNWTGGLAEPNAEKSDGPLATPAAAVEAVRKIRAAEPARKKPIVVMLRGGRYELAEPLAFGPDDSGTKDSPTIYRAYPDEKPVVSGGRAITGWNVNDKGFWQVKLPDVAAGKWEFSQLFVNGQRRYRPRRPEKDYFRIAAPAQASPTARSGTDRFHFNAGDIKADWHNLGDVELVLMNSWHTSRYRLKAVDGNAAQITGPGAGSAWWKGFIAQRRYFLENVREDLSAGRWYLDRKTGVLTYAPLEGETSDKAVVIAPRITRLVTFQGDIKNNRWVERLEFHGLTFAHCGYVLTRDPEIGGRGVPQAELDVDGAIKAVGMSDCLFKACTIEHVGQYGLRIDVACKRNRVEDCELIDLGGGGIWLGSTHKGGWASHDKLPEGVEMSDEIAASDNVVRNCLIAHGGRLHAGSIGIWIGQTHHNLVEHCEVYDFYYTGVNIGWSWGYGKTFSHHNLVRFNRIEKIGQSTLGDMGGVYTLGESPGTVFSNNFIKDVSANRGNQGCGIYTDQSSSYLLIENNLVIGAEDGGYHHHWGKEVVVRNNIFAFNNGSLKQTKPENHRSFTFTRNIVIWNHGPLTVGNWSGGYEMHHNLWWQSRGKRFDAPKNDRDSIVADPMFVDAEKLDFRLKDGSPALKIGFKPFDYTKAGRLKGFRTARDLPEVPRVLYWPTRP